MLACEHGRRFRARAQTLQPGRDDAEVTEEEEEEEEEEERCLLYALRATAGMDHEVLYDLGAREHDRGRAAEALAWCPSATSAQPTLRAVIRRGWTR
jgi:hypothetical protein